MSLPNMPRLYNYRLKVHHSHNIRVCTVTFRVISHKCLPHDTYLKGQGHTWWCTFSQLEFKGTHINVWSVTFSCMEGFLNKLGYYMSAILRGHITSKTHVPTSKVKIKLIVWRYSFSQEELEGTHLCLDFSGAFITFQWQLLFNFQITIFNFLIIGLLQRKLKKNKDSRIYCTVLHTHSPLFVTNTLIKHLESNNSIKYAISTFKPVDR
jgi:hypothetical protein